MSLIPMSHDLLVLRAGEWLRGHKNRCKAVALERRSRARCVPDALGWDYHGASTLVECKTSRSDFFSDQKKPHRAMEDHLCVGNYRYYMTPPDLVQPSEVPAGWGLLWCYESMVRQHVESEHHQLGDVAQKAERQILVAQVKTEERGHVNIQGEPLLSHPEYELSK